MKEIISIEVCLNKLAHISIIDVRSPGEFKQGHIPQANNIPLFSDEERAVIGTAYKQESKEKAIEWGYKFVNPKLKSFISESLNFAPNKEVIVHCWRGGMRSNAFVDHLLENGFKKVYLIEGGYKAYRSYIHAFFDNQFMLNVLGGYTGSGKTEILHCLNEKEQQIIDLEGLANHRGSAFGGIDLPQQPTTEQFENNLHYTMQAFDISKPIWIEDESIAIGKVNIPKNFFDQMRNQNIYFLNISQPERTKHLVDTYANLNNDKLAESIIKLTKRIGYDKVKLALDALKNKNYYQVVEIILVYYDKYYLRGLHKRNASKIIEIELATVKHSENADYLITLYNNKMTEVIKMTQYSHGAGCGCKISPKVLTTILESSQPKPYDSKLLVGNDTRDDAAVYDMGNGTAIISTTDFFLPIVDDPFKFGQIAATNAISDIYAMGGKPLMAIAILGWPINTIPPEVAAQVMEGGRKACLDAGIILAGGHSIDNPEPIFGLAVTGVANISDLKRNDQAKAGCKLYLTKPLGVGILATAQKNGLLKDAHKDIATNSMIILNDVGAQLAKMKSVTALTDVTGFGLLGHLLEVCEGSNVSAIIDFAKVPVFKEAKEYLEKECIPGGSIRNWDSYGHKLNINDQYKRNILCDPQTSGGLLIAIKEEGVEELETLLKSKGLVAECFGELVAKTDETVTLKK